MNNKERLVDHIQDLGLKNTMLKVLDRVEAVSKKHEIKTTDFLNPQEIVMACEILHTVRDIQYVVSGGYDEAERKLITIFPEYLEGYGVEIPIAVFEIKGTSPFEKLNHRDYLGAILGLGLKREKIGDIIVHNEISQVIVHESLKDYIFYNLNKVGNVSVKIKELEISDIIPPKIEYKEIRGNVSSLRLDAILSLAYKISRSEAQELISKERVSVNWKNTTKSAQDVTEGNIISVKGKGRVKIAAIEGKTKSDRIVVSVHKFV